MRRKLITQRAFRAEAYLPHPRHHRRSAIVNREPRFPTRSGSRAPLRGHINSGEGPQGVSVRVSLPSVLFSLSFSPCPPPCLFLYVSHRISRQFWFAGSFPWRRRFSCFGRPASYRLSTGGGCVWGGVNCCYFTSLRANVSKTRDTRLTSE